VQRIYRDESKQPLPLSESEFSQVISAQYMVFGRRGIGGPQLAETDRMLTAAAAHNDADRAWLERETARLAAAAAALDRAFRAMADG
jgi:argininosuccinate lyase